MYVYTADHYPAINYTACNKGAVERYNSNYSDKTITNWSVALQGMHKHYHNPSTYYTPLPCYVPALDRVTVNSSGMYTNGVYIPDSTWNFYPA